MKLSEFILENVNRILNNPLSREKYLPCYSEYGVNNPSGRCRICVAGYIRVLEHRLNKGVSKKDKVLNNCRIGDWPRAFFRLTGVYRSFPSIPAPEHKHFDTWEQFDRHIKSLRERAFTLKEKGL